MSEDNNPRPVLLAVDDDPHVVRAIARDLRARFSRSFRVLQAEETSKYLIDQIGQTPNIVVRRGTVVTGGTGRGG